MNMHHQYAFIFSNRYHIHRHITFWLLHIVSFTIIGYGSMPALSRAVTITLLWIPVYMLYMYPVMYWLVPRFLLKSRFVVFLCVLFLWVCAGLLLNFAFRAWIMLPIVAKLNATSLLHSGSYSPLAWSYSNVFAFGSFFAMNSMMGFGTMIKLFQYWHEKQGQLLQTEKEKISAELQLLKAQVHPHFLFNTLNNIYSFSIHQSPKTPEMILKLSALLSYVLYDCKADRVLLEKEIEIMKDYIDLEKERYGNRLDISLNFEGNLQDIYIAPLLVLPFLENAFKHGTAEQLEKPWLSMDISTRDDIIFCKIINSVSGNATPLKNGIGIENVKKRLEYIYPGKSKLKIDKENDFFVVSLEVKSGG